MADIAVVTAITGRRDRLLNQPRYKDVEYVAFLDELQIQPPWSLRTACQKFKNPVMNAKIHKMLTHKYVEEPYIVWLDGNRRLKRDPHELVELMADKDFAFFEHYDRRCVYKEIRTCLAVRKGKPEELAEQIGAYKKSEVPTNIGMFECSAFIRKNNETANIMFERWWAEVCRYSNRDQVSFPVVFQKQNIQVIPGKLFRGTNDYFTYEPHHG